MSQPPLRRAAPPRRTARAFALAALLVAAGCSDDATRPPELPVPRTSFARLQAKVLGPTCASAGCHVAGSAYARQSGLVLTRDVAYEQLVGVAPVNAHARADGLLRVMPGKPDSSFLLHKVHGEHHQGRDYGLQMPLGRRPLSLGQVEFIERWIAAGAPRDGDVVDALLLDDDTPLDGAPFEPLAPPARGYQLAVELFPVRPRFERELFVYRAVGNATDAYVDRIETKMRPGSHHLLAYTFGAIPANVRPAPDVVRDIRNPDGTLNLNNMLPMGWHVFFAGAMTETSDYRFPPGVALHLPAGAHLDLNSHYVNRSGARMWGEAYMNLHTVDPAQVQHVARTLNLNAFDVMLPPRQRTTLTRTFTFTQRTHVVVLTSHMHARGERFEIRIAGGPRDGELVYVSTDWAHPPIATYAQPIVLEPGEGLTSVVTYNNATNRTIGFGLTSEDEMDIIFGYYYR